MPDIASNVSFDTVAREWRCKWSPEDEKASLIALQKALEKHAPEVKKVDGFKSMQRVVCGGCQDFKVISSFEADKFGAWEASKFAPEKAFLEEIEKIPGVDLVETQTFTLMDA